MRHVSALMLSLLLALPAMAEDKPTRPSSELDQGFDLLGESARLLFRGLMAEMEPTLDEMADSLRSMEPALRDLAAMIGDIRNYEMPEKLPNGDIIIRRKPLIPKVPAPANPADELDL